MVLLFRSLMVLLMLWSPWLPIIGAQSPTRSARVLDAILQDYVYRAFVRPRTGVPYDGTVPSNLTGIKVSGLRLRSGSLRRRGVDAYKEFEIPVGVVVRPYVERLVLVYQNLGNWSDFYYPLSGYTYLAPMLGLLAYDAVNLSATNLPYLDIQASLDPIEIHFSNVKSVPNGSMVKCVWFDIHGNVNFSNVVLKNTCTAVQQGHFALVVETPAPSPTPSEAPSPSRISHKNTKKVWIIVGSVLGGVLLLVLLAMLLAWLRKYQKKKKLQHMEKASEVGEALRMTSVGNTKAPTAMGTRTPPSLESEYAP